VAQWEQGTWDVPLIPITTPDLTFGVYLWPKKANQGHMPLSDSSPMAKSSKDPDAAWEFITWWNTPENQIGWDTNAGGNPRPMLERYTELVETTVTPAWMKALRGEVSAKEALDESTRAATAFWQGLSGGANKAL